ncbi:MAG: (d)CMP kinase [Planctomycetota bacterium]
MSSLVRVPLPPGTLVIADLHLDLEREAGLGAFLAWAERARGAPRIVVLGDLFEYWFGMAQARSAGGRRVLAALAGLGAAGTAVEIVPGNRDFLLGRAFAAAARCRVHPAGLVGRLPGGADVLFLHGDELATLDRGYRRLRRLLRAAPVRLLGAHLPAPLGRALAGRFRRASRRAVARKPPAIAALQRGEARERARRAGAGTLVCGHAHVFRDELLEPGGPRWIVLGAFGTRGDVLEVGAAGELGPRAGSGGGWVDLRPPSSILGSPFSLPAPAGGRGGRISPRMIIALDGPAGSGKSTVAARLAEELGLAALDTGAMYRAVAWVVLARKIPPADGSACAAVAREVRLDFDEAGRISIDGAPGEPGIRGPAVTRCVSEVAAHEGVRAAIVARQREIAGRRRGIVAEGRDTTTVVFPDADHKFFLNATSRERARRRALQEGAPARIGAIQREIERRDRLDSTRAIAPLRRAPEAIVIETDGLTVDEVVARIRAAIDAGGRG